MQVICTDGTALQCQRFEAIDSGVLLFGESRRAESGEADEGETEEREEAKAFVPLHQLRYVLPEGIQPGTPGAQQVSRPAPQSGATGAPTTGASRRGRTPSRQPMGREQSSQPRGTGQHSSQPGSGRPR